MNSKKINVSLYNEISILVLYEDDLKRTHGSYCKYFLEYIRLDGVIELKIFGALQSMRLTLWKSVTKKLIGCCIVIHGCSTCVIKSAKTTGPQNEHSSYLGRLIWMEMIMHWSNQVLQGLAVKKSEMLEPSQRLLIH